MPRSCDVCQTSNALLFCRADAAYLCKGCDVKVHKANKLASRHERVWMCEVCEQAPAMFACKADAAVLCVSCDADIHSANRLAGRHERVRVTPLFESPSMVKHAHINVVVPSSGQDADNQVEDEENCEVEAASWLLPHPQPLVDNTFKNDSGAVRKNEEGDIGGRWDDNLSAQENLKIKEDLQHTGVFTRVDPYLELEHAWEVSHGPDSLVPVQSTDLVLHNSPLPSNGSASMKFEKLSCKDGCNYTVNFSSHSLSSCSTDSGVVPDVTSSDLSTPRALLSHVDHVDQVEPMAREARVLRYLEKRKNRKFEKTIRYASRKAYAETRPRIKGRFVKRSDSVSEQIYSVPDAGFVMTSC